MEEAEGTTTNSRQTRSNPSATVATASQKIERPAERFFAALARLPAFLDLCPDFVPALGGGGTHSSLVILLLSQAVL
jgi:hypothetical protein